MGDGGEGFIKVAVPDEISGAIRYHGFPIMPQLTVARLCKYFSFLSRGFGYSEFISGRMIARKCGITNPEDYGLYLLIDGYGKHDVGKRSVDEFSFFRDLLIVNRMSRRCQGPFEDGEQGAPLRLQAS